MIRVVAVRGTGEAPGSSENMLANVYRKLPYGLDHDLGYPATISFANAQHSLFGISGDRSVFMGVELLRDLIRRSPDDEFVLLGYSLGAIVVSKFIESADPAWLRQIRVVGNIANPLRLRGSGVGRPASTGFGLAGQRKVHPAEPPVIEIANPADFITNAAPNSLFRPFVEEILAFSVRDPGPAAAKFFGDTILGNNQIPIESLWDGRLDQAVADGRGYLTTAHTLDYGAPNWEYLGRRISGTDLLATLIRERL
ncbi:lysin B [Gordonia phage Archimedes]|uniref:Lysin B n=1 Tax=Gordonia phage Archimedes TaxID=2759389 RepID=A0A7L7SH31_9CAUD|nr:endolysin [Gordonia phage Archimedes]QOC55743.1 lysin B [Gordonia phage Archimedes]